MPGSRLPVGLYLLSIFSTGFHSWCLVSCALGYLCVKDTGSEEIICRMMNDGLPLKRILNFFGRCLGALESEINLIYVWDLRFLSSSNVLKQVVVLARATGPPLAGGCSLVGFVNFSTFFLYFPKFYILIIDIVLN